LQLKRLPELDKQKVYQAFGCEGLTVTDSKEELEAILMRENYDNCCLLMSSSGNFDGLDLQSLSEKLIK
ncbi:MAG: peptidoglycan synthetase, partial [Bacteroidales bacterium]|nr:peptidoglycan synthetase [Bacteroidales bacterium]